MRGCKLSHPTPNSQKVECNPASLAHALPSGLDGAAVRLAVQPPPLRRTAWLGGLSWSLRLRHSINQRLQPSQGIGLIAGQAAVGLCLDHQHALIGQPLIGQGQQAQFDVFGQAGRPHVKAQVRRAGHLVDVLPPGPLRADGGEFDLSRVDLGRLQNVAVTA
jgi:hypothetical protein